MLDVTSHAEVVTAIICPSGNPFGLLWRVPYIVCAERAFLVVVVQP